MKRLNYSLDYYDNKLNSFKNNFDSESKQVNELKDAIDSLSYKLNNIKTNDKIEVKKDKEVDEH